MPMPCLEDMEGMLGPNRHLQRAGSRGLSATVPSLRAALSQQKSIAEDVSVVRTHTGRAGCLLVGMCLMVFSGCALASLGC